MVIAVGFAMAARASVISVRFSGVAIDNPGPIPYSGFSLPAAFPKPGEPITGFFSFDPNLAMTPGPTVGSSGTSARFSDAITGFTFNFSGLIGNYSSSGGGLFNTYDGNNGYDSLSPVVTSTDGLTGASPVGYALVSASLLARGPGHLLSSADIPTPATSAEFAALFNSFNGRFFSATYKPTGGGGSDVTAYAQVFAIPVPDEASTFALMSLSLIAVAAYHRKFVAGARVCEGRTSDGSRRDG